MLTPRNVWLRTNILIAMCDLIDFYIISHTFHTFRRSSSSSSSYEMCVWKYIQHKNNCWILFTHEFTHNNFFSLCVTNFSRYSENKNWRHMSQKRNWSKTWHVWHFSQHFHIINHWTDFRLDDFNENPREKKIRYNRSFVWYLIQMNHSLFLDVALAITHTHSYMLCGRPKWNWYHCAVLFCLHVIETERSITR